MKHIKHIVVPTNFSAASRNAFQYAKHLAEKLDAAITVVHVNEYILPASEMNITPISELEINLLTRESMEMFVAEDAAHHDPVMVENNIKTQILRGDLVECLVDLSAGEKTDLIVMGTTGLQDFLTKIIGSASMEVANKAHCPVILVPRDTHWHDLNKIMYAGNYDATTPKMIEEVSGFARAFDASVHFVHVTDFNDSTENEAAEINWDAIFPSTKPGHPFEVHAIYGQDKIAELTKYAATHQINLMAFFGKQRNFWEHLMHKSVTEKMALSTETPMMIMHLDD